MSCIPVSERGLSEGWSEHRFISFDKTPIFYRRFLKDRAARAVIFILHGMGEHGGRYIELAEYLGSGGFECFLPDLRGFGKSAGKRGTLRHFSDYFEDLKVIQRLAGVPDDRRPFFVLGHSYGALVAASWVAAFPALRCRGLVLTSPNFGIAIRVGPVRHGLAIAMARVNPDFTQDNGVDPDLLTHDVSMRQRHARDPLIHGRISVGLYREMTGQLSRVDEVASKILCATLVLQAGDDRIVSQSATAHFFEKLASEDKELHVYENLYHEILNETERASIFTRIRDWLERRSNTL